MVYADISRLEIVRIVICKTDFDIMILYYTIKIRLPVLSFDSANFGIGISIRVMRSQRNIRVLCNIYYTSMSFP